MASKRQLIVDFQRTGSKGRLSSALSRERGGVGGLEGWQSDLKEFKWCGKILLRGLYNIFREAVTTFWCDVYLVSNLSTSIPLYFELCFLVLISFSLIFSLLISLACHLLCQSLVLCIHSIFFTNLSLYSLFLFIYFSIFISIFPHVFQLLFLSIFFVYFIFSVLIFSLMSFRFCLIHSPSLFLSIFPPIPLSHYPSIFQLPPVHSFPL